ERILGLVDVLELGRGRQLRRQRTLTARTPAIAHAAIDERARTCRAAARGTADRRIGPGAPPERLGRRDGPPGRHAAERALELVGGPRPGIAALDVLAAGGAQPRVGVRIALLRREDALEILGHHLRRRTAEHERRTQRAQDLWRRADRGAEYGCPAGE